MKTAETYTHTNNLTWSLFFASFLAININSAFGHVITYDLKGGQLPTGETEFSTESTNDETVLANPINGDFVFGGWCEKTDYEADNVCNSPKCITNNEVSWTIPCANDTINADTEYVALWKCPEVDKHSLQNDFSVLSTLEYDFNGNGEREVNECFTAFWVVSDPSQQNIADKGAKHVGCRYNETTHKYTDCTPIINVCNSMSWQAMNNIYANSANPTTVVNTYLSELGLNSNSVQWNELWNQNLANMSNNINNWSEYSPCNCNISLTVIDAPMCLLTNVSDVPNGSKYMVIRNNSTKYYVTLSETESVVHPGAKHKLKIKEGAKTYYAHDISLD